MYDQRYSGGNLNPPKEVIEQFLSDEKKKEEKKKKQTDDYKKQIDKLKNSIDSVNKQAQFNLTKIYELERRIKKFKTISIIAIILALICISLTFK